MAGEIDQWFVYCEEDERDEHVDLPHGSLAPTACPTDPEHAIGRVTLARCYDARNDLSQLLDVPTQNDDISKGWSVGSLIQVKDGNLWRCEDPTQGAAYWRDMSGGFPALPLDYATPAQPDGWESVSATYEALPRFPFPGRDKAGRPIRIYVLCKCDTDVTGQLRLVDVSASKTIAEGGTFTHTAWQEVDLGDVTNIADARAIWQIEVKRTAGDDKVYVSFVTVEF